jgi:hypothetical protein
LASYHLSIATRLKARGKLLNLSFFHFSTMSRSASPYAEQRYSPIPYGAPPQSPGGGPQITPGSITYTTSTGPDGTVIYHPFKAVPASYQTPTGIVTGIQWVPASATQILPNGAQPASVEFAEAWSRGNLSKEDQKNLRDWQRSEEKRRKKEEKESMKLLREKDRERYNQGRYDNDPDLRMARERDAVSLSRRRSFNQGVPPSVGFPTSTGGYPPQAPGYVGSDRNPGYAVSGAPGTQYATSSPNMGYARERKYSTGGTLAEQFADLGFEHDASDRIPPGGFARPRKYSTHEAVAERARRMSGNFGIERPPSAGGYAKPYIPGGAGVAYSNPSPGLRSVDPPYATAPRPSSPYGNMPYPSSAVQDPYGARTASPYHRSASPFAGGEIYPPGHIMEGRSAAGPTIRSRANSPMPGMPPTLPGMPGMSPSFGAASPSAGTLTAPDCFLRPINAAHPYTPFEPMKIQDMDLFLETVPRMPIVLQTHDVYNEDWNRIMNDIALAWSGRLPVPTPTNGKPPKRAALVAKLVELWNHSYFDRRGVELVLYKGRERRSGSQYGVVDMPYDDYDDDSSSSSSSDEDEDPRFGGFYGGYSGGHPLDMADTRQRRHAAKSEKSRRRKEKKLRRREKEKKYSLFLFCLPQGGSGGAGSIYGAPGSISAGPATFGSHSPALSGAMPGTFGSRSPALSGAMPGTFGSHSPALSGAMPGVAPSFPGGYTHSPVLRGPSPGPNIPNAPPMSSYPGMYNA